MGANTSSSVKEEPTTRVLSIDGGGVKALIPLVILAKLESQLQKIDGKDARIADYFDVIAGTNTGALTAAMLTTPNENNRPMFTAQEIIEFYLDNFPKIFPQGYNILSRAAKKYKQWVGEIKYNGKYVNSVIKEKLGDTKLNQTLTDIVITTDPITFSTNQVENKDVSLSDICIGSLAFPTYLSPHSFVTKDSDGNSKQFDLIGSPVDNPVNIYPHLTLSDKKNKQNSITNTNYFSGIFFLQILAAMMQIRKEKRNFSPFFLSVGILYKYTVMNGSSTVWRTIGRLASFVTDYDSLFYLQDAHGVEESLQRFLSQDNYLRIQDDSLTGAMCSMDVAMKKNLKNLVKVGENLLKKRVSRLDSKSRTYVPISEETNEEALIKLAATLSWEKRIRDPDFLAIATI
ncbi:PREDICTED: patatin-like protein 2 [Erythranthe guttata]|uniref:patatin-like protein 2 n=1 Tax=Erythranthe guttata TaxID=4155 RepID=UPI00064E0C88|nr:PREDICTED: patatin-like protein 2 [Erythranthe guttata]|eukprot:XP_012839471.1 PREDICTED: patatin-like protein 2 [Erythranthe guttata]